MSYDENSLSKREKRPDAFIEKGQRPTGGHCEAFAAGRRDVIGSPPLGDTFLAPTRTRGVSSHSRELAVISLVQRSLIKDRN
ncbi:hypothetical protein GCM10017643_39000 [Ancylobacter dichloromethanicus]|uniref:Uncharacterized protein n=1 Tax=Ancylobacter dichloromethanicus TaxID=518825 RepID=A0A9W6N189_9HYPH|nr:hypothetical protein GCM10017643_39000 [Ancylobacter dichloromethanicus]